MGDSEVFYARYYRTRVMVLALVVLPILFIFPFVYITVKYAFSQTVSLIIIMFGLTCTILVTLKLVFKIFITKAEIYFYEKGIVFISKNPGINKKEMRLSINNKKQISLGENLKTGEPFITLKSRGLFNSVVVLPSGSEKLRSDEWPLWVAINSRVFSE